jgi:hypothetical protein
MVIKKSSVESWQSSSWVPSEQLGESWALQGEAEKVALWVQVWSATQGDHDSWRISTVLNLNDFL